MSMSINELSIKMGDKVYSDPSFCRLLESYLPFLRTHPSTTLLPVTPHTVYKYGGDFYGLLSSLGVPPHLRWVTMRLNDVTDPKDVGESLAAIFIPNEGLVEKLKQYYKQLN